MRVDVHITLSADEYAGDLSGNSTELADAILKAVGGDEEKDTVAVQIHDQGRAGVKPEIVASPAAPPAAPPA